MVSCKIKIWPGGDKKKARVLGEVIIFNDATGNRKKGNYQVILKKSTEYSKTKGTWKKGTIKGFDRVKLGPYDILYLALLACGIDKRNKKNG